MKKYNKNTVDFLKGILIGIGVLIPGLSGATMAVLTRTFEPLVEAVANAKLHFKKSIFTLLPLLSGIVFSVYLISTPINYFCKSFPLFSKYLFILISILSAIGFFITSIERKVTLYKTVSLLCGLLIGMAVEIATRSISLQQSITNPVFLLIVGLPLSVSLVLPGISFSYMLLFFGIYNRTLEAIQVFDVPYLFYLAAGIIIWTYIFTKLLFRMISDYKQETYSFVLGFLLFSICDMLLK